MSRIDNIIIMSLNCWWLDKMPFGQNANQRLAFCTDFFLWLAFCLSQFLVGILSGTSQHVLALCPNQQMLSFFEIPCSTIGPSGLKK